MLNIDFVSSQERLSEKGKPFGASMVGREAKVVDFMDSKGSDWKESWNKFTTVVTVKDLKTNEMFSVYENQVVYKPLNAISDTVTVYPIHSTNN